MSGKGKVEPSAVDTDGDNNDGVEKLFAPVDLSKILKLLYMTTSMLILIAIGVIIVGVMTTESSVREQSIISACVTIVACAVAMYSGAYKDRGGLQLTYILYVWQLGNGTVLLYNGLANSSKLDNESCDTDADPEACRNQYRVSVAQTVLGTFSFFIGLATAWLVSNLSEKIQDEAGNSQRKQDIRFAIAAQHAKSRAVNRWQKAYGTGIRGRFKGLRSQESAGALSQDSSQTISGNSKSNANAETRNGEDPSSSSSSLRMRENPAGMRREDTRPGAMAIPALPHLAAT